MSTQSAPIGKMEFLSFQLGGMEYGVDFRKVKELRTFKSLERFASEGAIVKGVAVSRGVIMPLVDMRVAFNERVAERVAERAASPDPMTDVIILQLSTCVMGMVVDGVTDVVRMSPDQISPIPGLTRDSGCDYLMGLGETDGRRLILVDIDKLMSIRRESVAGAQKAA
ncbi:chemotaxis protein CheW [Massilia sp. CCM 8695]|uniref:Chemotaxis protein CheW n=2 Tax=Massilia frigida TaxID=2609281 RepID=A0ABX0N7E6_9BURK|nr:chemotaxis protein CheW [Massilia frigida]